MAELGETAFMMGAPEVGIPMEVGKQLAPHAPVLMMIPLVILSVIFIIIGIIVFSAASASAKTPGIMLLMLGLLLGGGAFYVMVKAEHKKNA
jgi:uncharacterized membrane-anchored protein